MKTIKNEVDTLKDIKVNIPRTNEDFTRGNGEGCFVSVSKDVFEKYTDDYQGGLFEGVLQNDSWYFPTLKNGTTIIFTMRGKNRPVAIIDELLKNHKPINDDAFQELLKEMSE